MATKKNRRLIRHKRIRAKVFGTKERPRLFVFRSNQHIYAQLINDEKSNVICSANDLEIKKAKTAAKAKEGKMFQAHAVGKLIAEKSLENKIKKVIFDRGGYKYHGRIRAVAEGAREAGLQF